MDTIKVTVSKDTIHSSNNQTSQHTTVETVKYNNNNDWLKDLLNSKIVDNLIWPITILIILLLFRKKIKYILDGFGDRMKRGDKIKIGKDGLSIEQAIPLKEDEVKKNAESEYEIMAEESKIKGIKGEVAEVQPQNEPSTAKDKFVKTYLSIEQIISDKFKLFFSDKFRIWTNYRIQQIEYDLILTAPLRQDEDKIIEIKYYPRGANLFYVRETLMRLYIAQKLYQETTKKATKPILLIVIPENKFILSEITKLSDAPKYLKQIKLDNLSLHFIKQEELNDLTKEKLSEMIE